MASLRILIADDNRDAAESLGILLGLTGHEVRITYDGSEALSDAAAWQPELVVLDLDMPVMNGFAAAVALREKCPGVALVALSGYLDEANRARASMAGFDRCFLKGVSFRELAQQLEQLGLSRKRRAAADARTASVIQDDGSARRPWPATPPL